MSLEYSEYLKSPQWLEKRKVILERDAHKCRCCGATVGLQVHHRQYHVNKITGEFQLPWDYLNKYLITFCDRCHMSGHKHFKVPSFTI